MSLRVFTFGIAHAVTSSAHRLGNIAWMRWLLAILPFFAIYYLTITSNIYATSIDSVDVPTVQLDDCRDSPFSGHGWSHRLGSFISRIMTFIPFFVPHDLVWQCILNFVRIGIILIVALFFSLYYCRYPALPLLAEEVSALSCSLSSSLSFSFQNAHGLHEIEIPSN